MQLDPQKEAELMKIYGVQAPDAGLAPEKEAQLREIYGVSDIGEDKGAARAALQGFNATVPFGERIVAGIGAGLAAPFVDESISDLYKQARANQQTTATANPNAYLAGTFGGIAATLPIGFSKASASTPALGNAANALTKASTATGNFIRGGSTVAGRALRGAAVAAPTSALYSYGASRNDLDSQEALGDAATGAGVGTALGGALPIAGAAAGSLIGGVADRVAGRMARSSGEVVDVARNPALQKVYAKLIKDYSPDEAQKVLNSYLSTKGKSLVEAGGKNTAKLAETAAQYPSGNVAASEFFDVATSKAPEKIKSSLGKNVSKETQYYDLADKISEEGQEKVRPLYKTAYKANQVIDSPIIDRILQTDQGKKALEFARQKMNAKMSLVSKPDPELTAIARELGMKATGQGIGRGIKLETGDQIKRGFDRAIGEAKRKGEYIGDLVELKNGLVGELDRLDKTKLYAKAREYSGDYITASDALEAGTNFLREDSQLVARNFKAMGPTERKAYKAGVVKVMREKIEARDDAAAISSLIGKGGTALSQKLKSVLSPKEYNSLINDALATDKLYKLKRQITGGSPTAGRLQAIKEFEGEGAAVIDDFINSGSAAKTAGNAAIRFIKKMGDGINDKSALEVSKILYETDPKKKYAIVKDLANLAKQNNPRGTEAAKKLKAFYNISDAIALRKQGTAGGTLPYVTLPQGQSVLIGE